jgi:hypothetical protein
MHGQRPYRVILAGCLVQAAGFMSTWERVRADMLLYAKGTCGFPFAARLRGSAHEHHVP